MPFKTLNSFEATFAPLIVQHATDSMVFTDVEGLAVWANKAFTRMSGYALSEFVGKKPGSILQGPDTNQETVSKIREAIKNRETIRTEILNYTKQGAAYWIDLKITPVFDEAGELTHFMSIERDITESKSLTRKTEAALFEERSRRRERKVLSQMSEWLFSAQSMEELERVVTRSMARLFPNTSGELFIYSNSRDVLVRVSSWGDAGEAAHLRADQCWGLRRGKNYSFGTSEIDFACDHVSSEAHPYFCMPIIAHGDTIGLMHIAFLEKRTCRETCEQMQRELSSSLEVAQICAEQVSLAAANVRLQTELQARSVKDPLTGLWNRRWFVDMANREVRRAEAARMPLTLAMLDIDHFKKFNDAHGHDAGDVVIKTMASHMSDLSSETVFPCRLGGEEFALVFPQTDAKEAALVVDGLRKRLSTAQIVHVGTTLPGVTFSAGIAQIEPREELASLMKRADEALYSAKEAGRNQTMLASADASRTLSTLSEAG